jgi:hypothetical protein
MSPYKDDQGYSTWVEDAMKYYYTPTRRAKIKD